MKENFNNPVPLERAWDEAHAMKNMVQNSTVTNFEQINKIIEECQKSPEFSEKFSGSLDKIIELKNKIQDDEKEVLKTKEEIWNNIEKNKGNLEANEDLLIEMINKKEPNFDKKLIKHRHPDYGDANPLIRKAAGNVALEKTEGVYSDAKEELTRLQEMKKELDLSEQKILALQNRKEPRDEKYFDEINKENDEKNKLRDKVNVFKEKVEKKLISLINKNTIEDDKLRLVTAGALELTSEEEYGFESWMRNFRDKVKSLGFDELTEATRYSDGDPYDKYKDGVWKEAFEYVIKTYGNLPEYMKPSEEKLVDLEKQKIVLEGKIKNINEDKEKSKTELDKVFKSIKELEEMRKKIETGKASNYEEAEKQLGKEHENAVFIEKSLSQAKEIYKTTHSDTHFDGYYFGKPKRLENGDYVATIISRTYEDYGAGDMDYKFLIVTDKDGNIISDKIGYGKYYNSEKNFKTFNFSDDNKNYTEILSAKAEKDKYILEVLCKDNSKKEFSGSLK